MEFIDKRQFSNQDEFMETVKLNKILKLFDAMKNSHPSLHIKMIKVMRDGDYIDTYEEAGLYKVKLSGGEMFDKVFGPIILSYSKLPLRRSDLVDIQPKEYFEGCHRTRSIVYKGVTIPDLPKFKFLVDFAIVRINKEDKND